MSAAPSPKMETGIRCWGSVAPAPGGRLPDDLEPISEPLVGRRFRKIGRFIKLALSGAATCVRRSELERLPPERTGVFFGTGIGNTPDLSGFSEAVLGGPTEQVPSPIQFAHSIGNSGAFYVAQAFELSGPVLAISQEDVSFECALLAARDALAFGDVDYALVGGADVYCPDDAAQRQRMGLAPSSAVPLSEGSGWVLLERLAPTSAAVLGEVRVEQEDPRLALQRQCSVAEGGEPSALAISARLAEGSPALASAVPHARLMANRGAFPTESAVALCAFLEERAAAAGGLSDLFHSIGVSRDGFLGLVSARWAGRAA
ncbi:MAG: hypothetical protein HY901_13075 [Deltaproteobacteria bacterium]|nr:hypothetical protein [Deltaproteobacteria bacterium]